MDSPAFEENSRLDFSGVTGDSPLLDCCFTFLPDPRSGFAFLGRFGPSCVNRSSFSRESWFTENPRSLLADPILLSLQLSCAVSSLFRPGAGPSHQAVLWIGQMLNAAVALAVYRLGKALWGDWRRAGLGMLLVGFVSQMPAYYAHLGALHLAHWPGVASPGNGDCSRYPAQRGDPIAPGDDERAGSWPVAEPLLRCASIGCLPGLLRWASPDRGFPGWSAGKREKLVATDFGVAVGFLLAAPWLYRMWGHAQSDVKVGVVSLSMQAVEDSYYPGFLAYLWHLLGPRRNYFFLLISLGGLPIAMRRRETRAFAVWALVLGLLTLPWGSSTWPRFVLITQRLSCFYRLPCCWLI